MLNKFKNYKRLYENLLSDYDVLKQKYKYSNDNISVLHSKISDLNLQLYNSNKKENIDNLILNILNDISKTIKEFEFDICYGNANSYCQIINSLLELAKIYKG